MLIPADGGLVEIDEDLLRFEIFLEPPRAEFTSEAGLLITSPRRFNVRWLHVIDPDDSCAQRLHNSEGFVNVARPDGGGEAVGRVVGDADGVGFTIEGNHGRNWAEDFFAGNARGVVHVVKNSRLDVKTLAELLRAAAADGDLCFFLADFQVGADAVILFFADQRTHFRFALERRAKLDALGLLGHRFHKYGVDFLFDENAAARGTDLALIDEDAEERAIYGGFPIGVREKNVGRFAAEFKRDTLERISGAFDDDFADGGAAGESDFIHAGMRYERGTRGFAEAVDDVYHTRRQANFGEIVRKFKRAERRLLSGLENAGATGRKRGREFPCGHEQRVVPRNDLAGYANGLAQREAERVGGNGIHAAKNFVGEAAVVLEASGDVGDVVLGFDDGLASIAAFDFGKLGGVLADFLGELKKDAASVLCGGGGPWAGVESGARGFYREIDVGGTG